MLAILAATIASLTATPPAAPVATAPQARSTPRVTNAAPKLPLAGVTVNIDPGHNPGNVNHTREINRQIDAGPLRKACDTTGTATNSGYPEARYTLAMATALASALRADGATVTFTHSGSKPPWGPCIPTRAAIGNRADVAISLHADGAPSGDRGFHVIRPTRIAGYTDDIYVASSDLATRVRNQLRAIPKGIPVSNYIGHDGIDTRGDLGGLNLSNVPKIFIEQGNMRNSRDAAMLQSSRERARIAAAVARALVSWQAARA